MTAGICLFVGKVNHRGCTLYIVHCTVVVVHKSVEGHYDVATVYEKNVAGNNQHELKPLLNDRYILSSREEKPTNTDL